MHRFLLHFIALILSVTALCGCGRKESASLDSFSRQVYTPQYARGFEILGAEGQESTILVCPTPWQGARADETQMLFIAHGDENPPQGFKGQVVRGDVRRVVCMSSTYIAMLDALDEIGRVAGVSGMQFISNPAILARRDSIADVGYDGAFDYERLLSLNPDIVLLYGVTSASSMEPKLQSLGIPYAYIGEYLEESPLGKAEWLVAIAEIIGKRDLGEARFAQIPKRYDELRAIAASASDTPAVMVNTPYRDSWIMAADSSYVARLIADANGRYIYSGNKTNRSEAIDLEQAYLLASQADCWINTGQIASIDELKTACPKFADLPVVTNRHVYNTVLKATAGGGNDYWESGVVNPHLVLTDLIKIFHPTLLTDQPFTYYRQL